mmetsp:Transcript_34122/g.53208  ORF Transcript_34122/g.53208 Transcript_34122/m.53208 type:complete len:454 (-) Transcript_34122:176-1537(-)
MPGLPGLKIEGKDAQITSRSVPAITCAASSVVVKGLKLISLGAQGCIYVPRSGSISVQDCDIRAPASSGIFMEGGKLQASNSQISMCGEYGILANTGSRAVCQSVHIKNNMKTGVLSRGKGASLTLNNSYLESNGANGAGCDEGGSLVLSGSKILSNQLVGINVGAHSSGNADSCEVRSNGSFGFAANGGDITISNSTIQDSGKLGIFIQGTAQAPDPKVECNRTVISQSKLHGIFLQGSGTLIGSKNEISDNGQSGVAVMGGKVGLSSSHINNNKVDGVHVGKDSSGKCGMADVSECTVTNNRRFGISAMGQGTSCTLKAVEILLSGLGTAGETAPQGQDAGHGIVVLKGAVVRASGCLISNNGRHGVLVDGTGEGGKPSVLRLQSSKVLNNAGSGAVSAEGSTFRVSSSEIEGNAEGDIQGPYIQESNIPLFIAAAVVLAAGFYTYKKFKK